MDISLYHTRNAFELLPTVTIAKCESERLRITDWRIIIGWCTLHIEFGFLHRWDN